MLNNIKHFLPKVILKSVLTLLIIVSLLITLPQEVKATPPIISGLSQNSISNDDVITISGANLLHQDTSNWEWSESQASFEGTDYIADGWIKYYSSGIDYVTEVALLGSQSSKSTFDLIWGNSVNPSNGKISGVPHTQRYLKDADVKWYRTYIRFSTNFWWPDNYFKIIYLQRGNGVIGARFGTGPTIPTNWHLHGNAPNYATVPQMYHGRWYCMEFKRERVDLGGDQYNVTQSMWLDGDFIDSATVQKGRPDAEVRSFDLGCASAASYKEADLPIYRLAMWHDGAVCSTKRIFPATVVEIGNSSDYNTASKVKQELLHAADEAIKFKTDLAGLGAGPYYLWVTNNRQERSAAYQIAGTGPNISPPSVYPVPDANNVAISSDISFSIRDSGGGVNIDSIKLRVNAKLIPQTDLEIKGEDLSDYTITYDPPNDFGYQNVINVSIEAQDLNDPPNVMKPYNYAFTTERQPIILLEYFDEGNLNKWLDDAKLGNFIVQSTTVRFKKYALQNELIQNAHDTGWLAHFFGDHPLGPNGEQEDEVWLQWYSNFIPGFVWPSHSVKMFIMNAFESWSAAYPPFNSWSPYYLAVAIDGDGIPFAILNSKTSGSSIWTNMPQNQGNALTVKPGQWYKFKFHLKLNTPGNSDGICEVWINDQLKVKYTNVNYRDYYTKYGWNHLMITASATPVSPQNQKMYWDYIVLSEKDIAPPTPPGELRISPK